MSSLSPSDCPSAGVARRKRCAGWRVLGMILLAAAAIGCSPRIAITTDVPVELYRGGPNPDHLFPGADGLTMPLHRVGRLEPGQTTRLGYLGGDTLRIVAIAEDDRWAWGYRTGGDKRPMRIREENFAPISRDVRDALAGKIRQGMSYLALWLSWGPPDPYQASSYVGPRSTFDTHYWRGQGGENWAVYVRDGVVDSWHKSRYAY